MVVARYWNVSIDKLFFIPASYTKQNFSTAMIMFSPYYDSECNRVAQWLSMDQIVLTRHSSVINQWWDVSIFTGPSKKKKRISNVPFV